jgi:hypothetical protein
MPGENSLFSLHAKKFSIEDVARIYHEKNYTFFPLDRDLDVNILGIRASRNEANLFDDLVVLIYSENGYPVLKKYPATTDPGNFWLFNPERVEGTAILVPNQYRGAYTMGLHKGREALVQAGNLKVYRDNNKDAILDCDPSTIQTGRFGINIHGESPTSESQTVGRWSAGCQVIQRDEDLQELLATCKRSARLYGPYFSYTLIEELDLG